LFYFFGLLVGMKKTKSLLINLQKETERLKDPERAKHSLRFFKTGKGEYGEGDRFYGLTNPVCHKLAKKYKNLSLRELQNLIRSKIHEERLITLLILVLKYKNGDEKLKKDIFDFYLKNTRYINNWDLVDLSAHKIIGEHVLQDQILKAGRVRKGLTLLEKLARSKNLWERRIAVISTFAFIAKGSADESLKICEILVGDKEDLIHKAVGWTLREVGKRVHFRDEKSFLDKHADKMPRTMLRYAIERFPKELRHEYLQIKQRTAFCH